MCCNKLFTAKSFRNISDFVFQQVCFKFENRIKFYNRIEIATLEYKNRKNEKRKKDKELGKHISNFEQLTQF